ncbi:hypothetical protein K474DRAFT_1680868, partial [Panus rudis PR-1116 ss-1]
MGEGSTDSTRTNVVHTARAASNDIRKGQQPTDKNNSRSLGRGKTTEIISGRHRDDKSTGSGTAADKGQPKQGTSASERAAFSTSGNHNGVPGVQSVSERAPDRLRTSDRDQNTSYRPDGASRTSHQQNTNVEGNREEPRGRIKGSNREQQKDGQGTGSSTSAVTTPGAEQLSGPEKAKLSDIAGQTNSAPQSKAVGMRTVSSGDGHGTRVVINATLDGRGKKNGMSEDGAGDIESTRSGEANGEPRSTGGKESSIDRV